MLTITFLYLVIIFVVIPALTIYLRSRVGRVKDSDSLG